jgi:hypothetical protein
MVSSGTVFLCLWVTRFGKFIAPKRYHEAGVADVEAYLRSLEAGGAEGWKVTQADEAIGVLYTKMYPVPWAGKWAVPAVLETRSPIQRPPVAKGFLDARFKGRRDDGLLPEMAAGILDGMRVRLREKHYSYRTEQTYLDWVRPRKRLRLTRFICDGVRLCSTCMFCTRSGMPGFTSASRAICVGDCMNIKTGNRLPRRFAVLGSSFTTRLILSKRMPRAASDF